MFDDLVTSLEGKLRGNETNLVFLKLLIENYPKYDRQLKKTIQHVSLALYNRHEKAPWLGNTMHPPLTF